MNWGSVYYMVLLRFLAYLNTSLCQTFSLIILIILSIRIPSDDNCSPYPSSATNRSNIPLNHPDHRRNCCHDDRRKQTIMIIKMMKLMTMTMTMIMMMPGKTLSCGSWWSARFNNPLKRKETCSLHQHTGHLHLRHRHHHHYHHQRHNQHHNHHHRQQNIQNCHTKLC